MVFTSFSKQRGNTSSFSAKFPMLAHGSTKAASVDPRSVEELTVNAVSSSDVLRAGQYSFRISIGNGWAGMG